MKIGTSADANTAAAVSNAATGSGPGVANASVGAPASAEASARVELSSTASTLLAGPSTSEFDAAKVARMAQAIQDGSFKVDPQAIADKLIANAQELLGQVPR